MYGCTSSAHGEQELMVFKSDLYGCSSSQLSQEDDTFYDLQSMPSYHVDKGEGMHDTLDVDNNARNDGL